MLHEQEKDKEAERMECSMKRETEMCGAAVPAGVARFLATFQKFKVGDELCLF